jgi:alpha-ketoglutaric semialdehyde dehydrogenase
MFKNLIGGEWVEGPRVSRNINPSDTRDVVGEFAQADLAQARQAIAVPAV